MLVVAGLGGDGGSQREKGHSSTSGNMWTIRAPSHSGRQAAVDATRFVFDEQGEGPGEVEGQTAGAEEGHAV